MRRVILVLGLLGLSSAARADAFALYLQGHGGPGQTSEARGAVLGLEAGGHVLFLGGYLTRDAYLQGGSVTRLVLGLDERIGVAGFRLTLRAGGGLIYEQDGVLERDPMAPAESGLVARAGASLEREISARVLVGLGVDAEYFAVRSALSTEVRTGTDVFGSLRLTFEIGL